MNDLLLFAAKYLYLVIALIALAYWLRVSKSEKIRLAIFGALVALTTFILTRIGSAIYFDPRPFMTEPVTPIYPHAPGNGFPSDHTALTAFIALTILSSSKKLGLFLLLLAITVGTARVLGHIHSPGDIVGSLVFAYLAYLLAHYATPKIVKLLKKPTAQ